MDSHNARTAIILFAHGSRVEAANEGVRALAGQVQEAGGFARVRAAFLELGRPDLKAAIAEAVEAGARRVVIAPYFLTLGVHLRRDLPELLAREKETHPEVEFMVSESLEGHPAMPSVVIDRILAISGSGA